ncbi:cupin domain-containing protein [Flagellimonas myxillae]|uniref:cupin domain-containing protein n=1 Tax=Flagellimonas myxillae TaxID=2942214 RepID=UPI00201F212C|nr:cupin domain-containing protein [Muricauda myxillae]MCL6267301.1 cupin domain-containing protein [Muricauda myxillae]
MKKSAKWVLGHKVSLHPTSGNYDLVFCETPPGAQGPPPHIHSNYEESFLIVEGQMEFMVDGTIITRSAGESIDVPAGTLHTFNNKTDKACSWINIHSPKGFAQFFETFGVPENEEHAIKKSVQPEVIQKVLQTAANFDMLIPAPAKE